MSTDGEMRDWWEINRLMTRYAIACDTCDWPLYRSLFEDDAQIDYRRAYGRAGPVDELVEWMAALFDRAMLPHTQHLLANLDIDVRGDGATGSVAYFNPDVIVQDGVRGLLANGGRYRFETRRSASGWRLSRLEAEIFWSIRSDLTTLAPVDPLSS